MSPVHRVALWDASSTADLTELLFSERVTDVFFRRCSPGRGTVVLGIVADESDGTQSIALCGVVTATQQVATGKDRVTIEQLRGFAAYPVAALRAAVRDKDLQSDPAPLEAVRLPLGLAGQVLDHLSQHVAGFRSWLATLAYIGEPIPKNDGLRIREERDAVSLAIEFSGVSVPPGSLLNGTSAFNRTTPLAAVFDPSVVTDTEDDLLAEDLRRFDPIGTLSLQTAARARFIDGDFILTIMNVNRKPHEHVLGVDLLYWDETANIFTLIQYKRLTRRPTDPRMPSDEQWGYRRREELLKQLTLMDLRDDGPADSANWRMTPSPFWFKFVREEDFVPNDPFVLRGMYVPADYLRAAIRDDALRSGPQGGFEVTYGNTRYITRAPFVELVRRRFTGTTSAMTQHVVAVADAKSADDEVVLAVRSKAPKPKKITFVETVF